MALEAATYINGLVSSNPPAGDPVTQADDHLRLIKATILATFPNLTGAVSVVQEKLNNSSPTGLIAMWYGSTASVPTGWGLCDGSTYAKMDASGNIVAPDLRNRFVIGAGSTYAVADAGGSLAAIVSSSTSAGTPAGTLDSQGAHTHSAATGSTVLDSTMIPAHTHTVTQKMVSGNTFGGGSWTGILLDATSNLATTDQTTPVTSGSAGGGLGHTHTISSDGAHTHTLTGTALAGHTHSVVPVLPPYYALAYIMRL